VFIQLILACLAVAEPVRTQLVTHDRTIGFHDVRLAELDLRVQCAETTNYDGILIWKIVEYQRRKREAVSGAVPVPTPQADTGLELPGGGRMGR